jgi:hypothetical protein
MQCGCARARGGGESFGTLGGAVSEWGNTCRTAGQVGVLKKTKYIETLQVCPHRRIRTHTHAHTHRGTCMHVHTRLRAHTDARPHARPHARICRQRLAHSRMQARARTHTPARTMLAPLAERL